MTEKHSNITNINIDNASDFIVENIIQYQNLSSLILNNIEIEKLEIINQLFDNLNLYKINSLDCNFYINKTKIQIKLVDGNFTPYLPNINSTVIKLFLINLPQCIESLYIEQLFYNYNLNQILDDAFVNLPSNLQNIEIKYLYDANKKSTKELESNGIFNCLFGAKLPFGCEMIVKVKFLLEEVQYKVIYENNLENKLTLLEFGLEEQIIIEKVIIERAEMYTYAKNYNVLRIMSGMGGLSYSS